MRQICYIFFYLNIYTGFFSLAHSQEITLTVTYQTSLSKSSKDALGVSKKHKDFKSVSQEVERISSKLETLGYLENRLNSLKRVSDSAAAAHFFLGKKYTQLKIDFSNTTFTEDDLAQFSENINGNYLTIPIQQSKSILEKLNRLQTKNGNTFGKLKLTNLVRQDSTLVALLHTSARSKRTIDSIAIKGYQKFPKSFVTYFAGIKKGIAFDNTQIVKKNNVLNSLGFVNSIKPPQALFEKEKTTLYLYLEKQNFNTFDGIIGFSTDEQTQNLIFNGYIDLVLNNNLNYGEQFVIKYKADGNNQENLTLKAQLPYVFKSPIGIQAELNIFRRDSTFSSASQQINTSYQVSPACKAFIGFNSKTSNELLTDNTDPQNIQDFKTNSLRAGVAIMKLQNSILFPVKTLFNLQLGLGSRETNTNNTRQFSVSNAMHHTFNINQKTALFLKNTTQLIASDTYLTNELFRFGGINSMRGFAENSIDASLLCVVNTEYRYLLNQQTYLHSIIDIGYFENEIVNQNEKLYSAGLGFGMITKAGLLKFVVANGNIDGQAFKFSNSKIHLSIASQF